MQYITIKFKEATRHHIALALLLTLTAVLAMISPFVSWEYVNYLRPFPSSSIVAGQFGPWTTCTSSGITGGALAYLTANPTLNCKSNWEHDENAFRRILNSFLSLKSVWTLAEDEERTERTTAMTMYRDIGWAGVASITLSFLLMLLSIFIAIYGGNLIRTLPASIGFALLFYVTGFILCLTSSWRRAELTTMLVPVLSVGTLGGRTLWPDSGVGLGAIVMVCLSFSLAVAIYKRREIITCDVESVY